MKFEIDISENVQRLHLNSESHKATIDNNTYSYSFHKQENGRYLLRRGTNLYKIDNVSYQKHSVEFTMDGNWYRAEVKDEQDLLLDKLGFKTVAELGEGQLNAPMPGKILEIIVSEGDTVTLGDPVVILEAMKMENELKAPVSGTIADIQAKEGDSLEKNALILEIEASG